MPRWIGTLIEGLSVSMRGVYGIILTGVNLVSVIQSDPTQTES